MQCNYVDDYATIIILLQIINMYIYYAAHIISKTILHYIILYRISIVLFVLKNVTYNTVQCKLQPQRIIMLY